MLPDWNYVRQVQSERVVLANAYLEMANRQRAERDYAGAQALYQKVVGLIPNDKAVWTCLGECWTNLAKYPRAHACYKQALACDPAFVPALLGLAECVTLEKRPKQALKLLKRVEALLDDEPTVNAHWWVARGNAHTMLAEPGRAERAYRRAMELKPDYHAPYGNLGNILCLRGEHAEARTLYEKAYAMAGDPVIGMNLGILALTLGDYGEGWRRYGARLDDPRHLEFQRFDQARRWTGEPMDTLYICGEQGLGDLAQFIRYLPLARQRCRRLILEVTRGWEELARSFGFADEVRTRWDSTPIPVAYDAWAPLLSLPMLLELPRPEQAPKPPYLDALNIEPAGRPAIALFWRGNPAHPNDLNRSIPLKALTPLVRALPDAHWFTLHPEREAGEDIKRCGLPVEQIVCGLPEAAQRLKTADLVIGADTAPIHLAGALDRPTWALLPPNPDWRWGLTGASTPWYPKMRLFRATKAREWAPVVEEAALALGRL